MSKKAENARYYIQQCFENRHNQEYWDDYDLIGALLSCASDLAVVCIQQQLQDGYPYITPE